MLSLFCFSELCVKIFRDFLSVSNSLISGEFSALADPQAKKKRKAPAKTKKLKNTSARTDVLLQRILMLIYGTHFDIEP